MMQRLASHPSLIRSMSANIVRYSGSSTTLVRAADARSPFTPRARDR
jgi:hypothetical protein